MTMTYFPVQMPHDVNDYDINWDESGFAFDMLPQLLANSGEQKKGESLIRSENVTCFMLWG